MKRWLWTMAAALALAAAPLAVGLVPGGAVSPAEAAEAKLTLHDATRLFDAMARQNDIAFHYVSDGCYARAYLMVVRLQKMGAQPARVWAFPTSGGKFRVRTSLVKQGFVDWDYHVAPVISVTVRGKATNMVVDPSLFQRPVTTEEWSAVLQNTHGGQAILRFTKVGEAPLLANGHRAPGTGYWPVADPPEGLAAHAAKTMRKLKRLEPR